MNKIAPFPVHAMSFLEKDPTLFSFIFGVHLLIFSEFVRAMGELALLLVGTKAELKVFFAELRFFLILLYGRFSVSGGWLVARRTRVLGRGRVVQVFLLRIRGHRRQRQLQVSSQHIATLIVNYI